MAAAKRAADTEPVIITDRGVPSHVLLSYREYISSLAEEPSIVEILSMDDDIEFEPTRLTVDLRVPDL